MSEIDTKFELCSNVENVLKIGRDYQNKDGDRGAHYDTVKLLCDTIEYLRDQLPKPDPDWKEICEKCHDGEIEPKECEYYGEPDGCNSPIYGEHPKANPGNAAAMREALRLCREEMCDICDNEKPCKLKCVHVGIIDRALSDPPRNCDRFKTASEASDAWLELDDNDDGALEPFDWLFAQAKEGGVTDGVQSAS